MEQGALVLLLDKVGLKPGLNLNLPKYLVSSYYCLSTDSQDPGIFFQHFYSAAIRLYGGHPV